MNTKMDEKERKRSDKNNAYTIIIAKEKAIEWISICRQKKERKREKNDVRRRKKEEKKKKEADEQKCTEKKRRRGIYTIYLVRVSHRAKKYSC